MKLTPSQKETVRHEFDRYCKRVLRGEASDYDDHLSWRSKYETTLSGLSEKQMGALSVPDEYSCEQFRFQVQGYSILIRSETLANALARLSKRRLYDENGVEHFCVDEEKLCRMRTKLITKILEFKVIRTA